MKKAYLFLLLAIIVAGCRNGSDNGIIVDDTDVPCISEIQDVTVDNGNLTVETAHHVIKMDGNQKSKYKYYIWNGDKDENVDEPDVIVDGDDILVRQAD